MPQTTENTETTAAKPRKKRGRLKTPKEVTMPNQGPVEAKERTIYKALRHSLMSGAWAPGALISSRSLAESFGVSPMPVREALKRLEADGVLKSRIKRGFAVRELTSGEQQEFLKIRLHLEGMVVREAALNITPAGVEIVRVLEQRLKQPHQDFREVLEINHQLHFSIYRWAKMPIALAMIEDLWLRLGPALHHVGGDYSLDMAHTHHERIIAGLAVNDPDAAEHALRCDLIDAAISMGRNNHDDTAQ